MLEQTTVLCLSSCQVNLDKSFAGRKSVIKNKNEYVEFVFYFFYRFAK